MLFQIATLVINCLIIILVMRFMFQAVQVNRFDPVVMSTYQATGIVDVFNRILPAVGGGRINLAALALIFIIQAGVYTTQSMLPDGISHSPFNLFMLVATEVADWLLAFFYWTLIIYVVLSWVMLLTQRQNPLIHLCAEVCQPILAPLDRFIPPIGPINITLPIALIVIHGLRGVLETAIVQWFRAG